MVNPEVENRPLVLLVTSREEAQTLRDHLVRVGIDNVRGFITSLDDLELVKPKLIQPEELDSFEHALLLDVRNKTEFADGHRPGAEQLSGGRVLWFQEQLPRLGRDPRPRTGHRLTTLKPR